MTRERYQYLVRKIEEAEAKGEISEAVAIFATSDLYYQYRTLQERRRNSFNAAFGGSK